MKPLSFALIVGSRSIREIVSETVQKASQETLSSCIYIHILDNSEETVFKIKKKPLSCVGSHREINHVFSFKLVWWATGRWNSQAVELWSNLHWSSTSASCSKQVCLLRQMRWLRTVSAYILKNYKDGDSPASLEALLQRLTITPCPSVVHVREKSAPSSALPCIRMELQPPLLYFPGLNKASSCVSPPKLCISTLYLP